MQITPLEEADEKACERILSQCIKDAHRELTEYLQNQNVRVFCAKEADATVGALCLLLCTDTADILDIAVSPQNQKKGIGSALVSFAKDFCKEQGMQSLMLEVRASNIGAISLYEKCGFEKISVRKNYYSAPTEDAIIYRSEL